MLSGLDCRITRASGTLDKRSDGIGSRNSGRRGDRRASGRCRQRGVYRDDADDAYGTSSNNTNDNTNHDDSGRPWHDSRHGRGRKATDGEESETDGGREAA